MRVVLLNRFFFPDHAPTGVLVSDLAFFLRRQNIDVVAISSRARYGSEGPPLPKREFINGVEIHRVWSAMGSQPSSRATGAAHWIWTRLECSTMT